MDTCSPISSIKMSLKKIKGATHKNRDIDTSCLQIKSNSSKKINVIVKETRSKICVSSRE